MKVKDYEQLTKEEKIQLLIDQQWEIINRNQKGDIKLTDARALSILRLIDLPRLENKNTCQECMNHNHEFNQCTIDGRQVVDFAGEECTEYIEEVL